MENGERMVMRLLTPPERKGGPMRRFLALLPVVIIPFVVGSIHLRGEQPSVTADIVATGIPGASAIAQVGTFHTGGPFHDRPAFAAETAPGHVLARARLFVASTSNF